VAEITAKTLERDETRSDRQWGRSFGVVQIVVSLLLLLGGLATLWNALDKQAALAQERIASLQQRQTEHTAQIGGLNGQEIAIGKRLERIETNVSWIRAALERKHW
jgi:hypothetical protein